MTPHSLSARSALVLFVVGLVAALSGAPTEAATFDVDTTDSSSIFSNEQCVEGTIDGTPSGTPITEADARAGDGTLSIREAICLANHSPDAVDTVTLPTDAHFSQFFADNTEMGANGLPAITGYVVLEGNGATIQRADSPEVPFRFFYVAADAHLVLRRVELRGGLALGESSQGVSGAGGSADGLGGAVLNDGTLEVVESALFENVAQGGAAPGGTGGAGLGGGIFNRGGTVSIVNSSFFDNEAIGGDGSEPGVGLGACVFSDAGSLDLLHATLLSNQADEGGAIYGIAETGESLTLDVFNSILSASRLPVSPPFTPTSDCFLEQAGGVVTATIDDTIIERGTNCSGTSSAHPVFNGIVTKPGRTSTITISDTSPGIDADSGDGDCLPADQLGVARPLGPHCDLGAYEAEKADLSITKQATPAIARPGDIVTYVLTAHNAGPSATQILFTDGLPGGVTLVSAPDCVEFPPSILTCGLPGLYAPGASASVTIIARVGELPPGTVVTNFASVTGSEFDPDVANDSATASFTVGSFFDPAIPTLDGRALLALVVLIGLLGAALLRQRS